MDAAAALGLGTLIETPRHCLALEGEFGNPDADLRWPAGYQLAHEADGRTAVADPQGQIAAHVGDRIRVGGAYVATTQHCQGTEELQIMGDVEIAPLEPVTQEGGCPSSLEWVQLLDDYRRLEWSVYLVSAAATSGTESVGGSIYTKVSLDSAEHLAGPDLLSSMREIRVVGGKVGETEMQVADGPTLFLAPGQAAIVMLAASPDGGPPTVTNTLPVDYARVVFYDGQCANRTGLAVTAYHGTAKELRRGGVVVEVALNGGSMPVEQLTDLLNRGSSPAG
ncbi:MAG: hypothetical protein ABI912_07155 [Actinomycetota bacterium]